jgi:hypothetical protein
VIRRHFGEQPLHQRTDGFCDDDQQSPGFGDLHQPEKQAHDTNKLNRQRYSATGTFHHRAAEGVHGRRAFRRQEQLTVRGRRKGNGDESEKNDIHVGVTLA